ncbi:MAG TPA: helix-turn-helix transcriptional regulator [Mycobacteriales bacterium]|nr:helix-turn-helix transcriptional regulator [Mycobacteriales bacterium]
MRQTTDGHLRRVMDVIDADARSAPVPGRLSAPVLHALGALVPTDLVSFLDLEPSTTTVHADDELVGGEVSYSAAPVTDPDEPFWRHYHSADCCSYPTKTGDDRSVTSRSDFYSTREWKQSTMYAECFADGDFTYELMCPLPSAGGRTRRVVFLRSGSCDFTDQDRFALALLRPHLTEIVSRRQPAARSSALTQRQAELLQLVADGRTNAEIAVTLHLSPHTVRTHLTNIFERLGVSTRAAAVARVLSS